MDDWSEWAEKGPARNWQNYWLIGRLLCREMTFHIHRNVLYVFSFGIKVAPPWWQEMEKKYTPLSSMY